MFALGFHCHRCGNDTDGLDGPFACPTCGSTVELRYDLAALGRAHRRPQGKPADGTGLWRYAALLPVTQEAARPPLHIGGTPLYEAPRLATELGLARLWLKDETVQPSGSLKDRAGAVVAARAAETSATVIACASTGNAGSSMACIGAATGQHVVVFVPRAAPPAKVAQLMTFGAQVFAVDGSYDDAFGLCAEVCRRRGWLDRSTATNPFTREGKKTCAFELAEQLAWRVPDRVAVSVGDGNILTGLWKGFRELHALGWIERIPSLVAVQATGSPAITRAVAAARADRDNHLDPTRIHIPTVRPDTIADSISVGRPADGLAAVRAVLETEGLAVTVDDETILAAIPLLARHTGIFAEPAGAAALAGVAQLRRQGVLSPDETVACVVTGSGLKDVAAAAKVAGTPPVVPPDADAFDALWEA